MFNKQRFVAEPQLDSEGFPLEVPADAKCVVCEPVDLRSIELHGSSDVQHVSTAPVCVTNHSPPAGHGQQNPEGWREPGMQPINWAERFERAVKLGRAE